MLNSLLLHARLSLAAASRKASYIVLHQLLIAVASLVQSLGSTMHRLQ